MRETLWPGWAAALALAAVAGILADSQENAWREGAVVTALATAVLFMSCYGALRQSFGSAVGSSGGNWLRLLYAVCAFLFLGAIWPPEYKAIYAGSDYRAPYQLPGPEDGAWSQGMAREITVAGSGRAGLLIRLDLHESHDKLPPTLEVTAGGRRAGEIRIKPGNGSEYPHWREKGLASSYRVVIPSGYLTPEKNEVIFRPVAGSWIALKSVRMWELPAPWSPWRFVIEPWNWILFWISAGIILACRLQDMRRAHGARKALMGAMMGLMVLAALALALCATAVYVEARYRWMITQPDNFRSREMFYGSKHLRDARLGWRLLPGFTAYTIENGDSRPAPFYQVNNHGFRSLSGEMDFPPKGKLLMLGDSFAQGAFLGQEETMASVISRRLNGYVYNLGVGAYSTDQEYTAFMQWIDRLDAEWVALFFFANDVLFVDKPVGHKFEKPVYRIVDGKVDFSSLAPLQEKFVQEENQKIFSKIEMEKTFCCFSAISESLAQRAAARAAEYLYKAHYPGLLLSAIVDGVRKTKGVPTPGHMDVTADLYENPGPYAGRMDIAFQFISRIQEESRKRGKKFFVVYIPDFLQMSEQEKPERSNFRKMFMKMCQDRGTPCLDPSDELAEGSRYNDAYFIDDGHLSPHGARIVGELAAEAIARNRF